jgi:hypothetical protein
LYVRSVTRREALESNEVGRKDDAGKIRAGVLLDFAHALVEVAEVGDFGIKKYERLNWVRVPDGQQRYMDAAMRHLLAHGGGQYTDPESELSHLAHAVWCLLAVMELEVRNAPS